MIWCLEALVHFVQECEVYAAPWGQFPYLQGPRETPYPPGHKVRCLKSTSPLRFYLCNLLSRP